MFIALTILLIGPHLKLDLSSIALFIVGLAFSDYLRAKLFTGFPWNLWAYSTSTINEFLQILNIIGLHSYNLLVITLFSLPAIIFLKVNKFKKYTILSIGIFSVFALFIFGNYEININKKNLEVIENKIYVKIIFQT